MSSRNDGMPRIVRLRPGPAGSVAGDVYDGRASAASLVRVPGSDGDVELLGRSAVSDAPFSATNPAAAGKLRRILAGEGILVSTGQQPGLFLGPLFTLYKILTAVAHAERIEAATGRPALASFWIAADDHDWNEVGTASIIDRGGDVRRVRLVPDASEADRAVGRAVPGDRLPPLLEEFLSAAGDSEFADQSARLLTDSYTTHASVTSAFRDCFIALLQGIDVVFFDPTHPDARGAAAPFLSTLLESYEAVAEAFEAGTAMVASRGYDPQLRRPEGGAQLFYDDGNSRRHLLRSAGGFIAGREGEWRSARDWQESLVSDPSRFSPAAGTRPLLESWLLPVARTVVGPGEMAYWAQLGALFERLEVDRPETVSRESWLLLEPKVERWLRGIDADPLELADGGTSVQDRLTAEHRPEAVERGIEELRRSLNEKFENLADTTRAELPGLDAAFGKAEKLVEDALTSLEDTIDARVRESRRTSIDRARRAASLLYPEGRPQERLDSAFSFFVRYGPGVLDELLTAHGIEQSG